MQERRAAMRRESDNCPFRDNIQELNRQSDRIDLFIDEAGPLMEYVKAEIERNKKRAEFYQKISEHVLGAAIIAIFAIIGSWLIEKIKSDIGH